jgi:hypothetical protein
LRARAHILIHMWEQLDTFVIYKKKKKERKREKNEEEIRIVQSDKINCPYLEAKSTYVALCARARKVYVQPTFGRSILYRMHRSLV